MWENKEEFDRFAESVKKATCRKLTGKESKSLQQILSQGDSSNEEDASSVCNYDDVQPGGEAEKESKPSPPKEYVIPGGSGKEGVAAPAAEVKQFIILSRHLF